METYTCPDDRVAGSGPLEAGIVAQPWDYSWSSAPTNAAGVTTALVTESAEYDELGFDASRRQE
jgi:hypothetical protein